MAYLEQLPEEKLRVNGFRRIKGNEYYVEWRRVGGGSTDPEFDIGDGM